eukprot:5451049-Prymnesium_polylepis.1
MLKLSSCSLLGMAVIAANVDETYRITAAGQAEARAERAEARVASLQKALASAEAKLAVEKGLLVHKVVEGELDENTPLQAQRAAVAGERPVQPAAGGRHPQAPAARSQGVGAPGDGEAGVVRGAVGLTPPESSNPHARAAARTHSGERRRTAAVFPAIFFGRVVWVRSPRARRLRGSEAKVKARAKGFVLLQSELETAVTELKAKLGEEADKRRMVEVELTKIAAELETASKKKRTFRRFLKV